MIYSFIYLKGTFKREMFIEKDLANEDHNDDHLDTDAAMGGFMYFATALAPRTLVKTIPHIMHSLSFFKIAICNNTHFFITSLLSNVHYTFDSVQKTCNRKGGL